jgi:hypothetical protein
VVFTSNNNLNVLLGGTYEILVGFFLGACSNVGLDTVFFAVDIGVLKSFVILL